MNTMFVETVQLSVTAGVDPGIQNHSLFFLEVAYDQHNNFLSLHNFLA